MISLEPSRNIHLAMAQLKRGHTFVAVLMRLSMMLSCIIACHGFTGPAAGKTTAIGTYRSSPATHKVLPTPTPSCHQIRDAGKQPSLMMANENIIHAGVSCCRMGGSCSNSKSILFPRRKTSSDRQLSIMMATDDSSNEVSGGGGNPLVKAWLSFRKLLAKIWVSLVVSESAATFWYVL